MSKTHLKPNFIDRRIETGLKSYSVEYLIPPLEETSPSKKEILPPEDLITSSADITLCAWQRLITIKRRDIVNKHLAFILWF